MACIYNIPASSSQVKTIFTSGATLSNEQRNSLFVVTFSGFICTDVWLASKESRKTISPRIFLVQPLSVLKSGRKKAVSVNNKGGVSFLDRIYPLTSFCGRDWQTGPEFSVDLLISLFQPSVNLIILVIHYVKEDEMFQNRKSISTQKQQRHFFIAWKIWVL